MGCVPVGLRFDVGCSFKGEEGKAPGMAADVSDMMADEVSFVRLVWSRVPGCCALCMPGAGILRLPVLGSISPVSSLPGMSCDSAAWSEGRSGEAELWGERPDEWCCWCCNGGDCWWGGGMAGSNR